MSDDDDAPIGARSLRAVSDGEMLENLRAAGVGRTGFAPSASSAAKSLGVGTPIQQDRHPPGVEGTNYSLKKMAEFVRDGRNDPRVRGWAGQVLIKAGKPKTVKAQAQALLDALRAQTVYVQDPVNTETMAKAHITLCLGKDLCLPAADCDDRCIALASALMSIGIETRIVGAAYNTTQATHVLLSIQDENGEWLKIDPSSETYRVGQSYPASKEWIVDPITSSISNSPGGPVTSLGKDPGGDFIGVGAIPFAHAFSPLTHGAAYTPVGLERGFGCCDGTECGDETASEEVEVAGVGAIPFAHAFSSLTHGAAYTPVGLGAVGDESECGDEISRP